MGLLIDGVWHDQWYETSNTGGHFQRKESRFRNWVTADGAQGPSGAGGFRAEHMTDVRFVPLLDGVAKEP